MENHLRTLRAIRRRIDGNIPQIQKYKENRTVLIEIEGLLEEELENYRLNSDEFCDYLKDIQPDIQEAATELSSHLLIRKSIEEKVDFSIDVINQLLTDLDDEEKQCSRSSGSKRSKYSRSSGRSKRSNTSDILLEKKAKAEAAKARLEFERKGAELLKEKARLEEDQMKAKALTERKKSELEVDIKILQKEQDVAVTHAEVKAVEEYLEQSTSDRSSAGDSHSQLPTVSANKNEIVKNFLEKLPDVQDQRHNKHEDLVPPLDKRLNPTVPEFVPEETAPEAQEKGFSVLMKYIMKKDLLLSRLSNFDDRAERYYSWKNSFHNITNELDVTATEEIDLLVRYLGPDSKRQAVSIRVTNSHNDKEALVKIRQRLDERFGAPEHVVESLHTRVEKFPKVTISDKSKLYDLSDLFAEIECVKTNDKYRVAMSYFDSSLGVNTLLYKLPTFIQNKWIDHCSAYKMQNNVMYPPFHVFSEFIRKMALRQNDPSFNFDRSDRSASVRYSDGSASSRPTHRERQPQVMGVYNKKTNLDNENNQLNGKNLMCVLHGEHSKHKLKDCRIFCEKSIPEKREIVKKHGICFKCLDNKHLARDCQESITCEKCNSARHCTAFHNPEPQKDHGGERGKETVGTNCTEICGQNDIFRGKSCAKTILVWVYPEGKPDKAVKCYAIIDDQSNKFLGRSELFNTFRDVPTDTVEYTLRSCAGSDTRSGRRASGLIIESYDGTCWLKCPPILECNDIPDNKEEIATPSIARNYKHLRDIESMLPDINSQAPILLLIGRDLLAAHHVLDQRIGQGNEPYAQCLRLGWVIVGETCLGKVHQPEELNVFKTNVLVDGRKTLFQPCDNMFEVKEQDIFQRTPEDDIPGLSQEDRKFVKLMEEEMVKTSDGHLSAPLPFKEARAKLPNNRIQAQRRAENLAKQLHHNNVKQEHFVQFMGRILDNHHAEEAPPEEESEEAWYLPIFGVYHPKNQTKFEWYSIHPRSFKEYV